ncbi:hypothetical protein [Aequorivita sinensis]|uniref:hypothetical protein n=1 Tax=Aequorivita sinensis TaxID=1382458 RepID=UPI001120043D|nr:hypothetical protein [Aequorivita sinensis]
MKKHLQIFILILAFTSCSDGTDIRKFAVEEIEFVKMPLEVQAAIKDYYRPTKEVNKDGDTLTHYGLKDELICLDSAISKCEFEAVWSRLVSSWLDHLKLKIDDRTIIIEQGVNVYNRPYVVYDGHLYCRTNMNARSLNNPSKDEFKVLKINKN